MVHLKFVQFLCVNFKERTINTFYIPVNDMNAKCLGVKCTCV